MQSRTPEHTMRHDVRSDARADLRVRDVMKSQRMICAETDARLPSSAPLELAAAVMAFEQAPAIPVFEGGRAVGVVTEMDILRSLSPEHRARALAA